MNRRRFTLLELIVVLVVVATVIAIVMPRLGLVPRGVRITQFADSVASSFNAAATLAMTTGRPVKVHIEFDNRQVRIEAANVHRMRAAAEGAYSDADNFDAASALNRLKRFPWPEGVRLDEESFDYDGQAAYYEFFPNGEATGPYLPVRIDELHTAIEVDRLNGRAIMAPITGQ
jgi:type II secretory pathway pseudopilin PulG